MRKFEYLLRRYDIGLVNGKIDIELTNEEMNKLGEDGWELVDSIQTDKNGYTKDVVCVFKREV